MSFSAPVSRRNDSSASTASISVSRPRGASASNHARNRASAAPSRSCAARAPTSSALFLAAFIKTNRIGADVRLATGPLERLGQQRRRGRAVEHHMRALFAKPLDERNERVRLGQFDMVAELVAGGRRHLVRIDQQNRSAVAGNIGVAQGQGRMRDIRATNVEQPRKIAWIADQQTVGALNAPLSPARPSPPTARRRSASCAA